MQFSGKQLTLIVFRNIKFIVGLLAFIPMANAANLTLAWNPSSSPESSGYKLHYGTSSQQYTQSVNVGNTTTHTLEGLLPGQTYYVAATAYCNCDSFQESNFSSELEVKIPAADELAAPVVPQGDWKLVYVDSEETRAEDSHGINAFDGNANTYWHTAWSYNKPSHPHEIQIDLGKVYELESFSYLPRQDGNINGHIKDYAFYVSHDRSNWGQPAVSGVFPNSTSKHTVALAKSAVGRFIRLVALSEVNGKPITSVAELELRGSPSSTPPQENDNPSTGNPPGDSGGAGTDTPDSTMPPPIEVGEVVVGPEWKKVDFQKNFADPVVVAPAPSYVGSDPGVVKIRNITSNGFEIRFQEWDYLDGRHYQEKVHFIAMERGHYTLPNGARIEAGTTETGATTAFDKTRFVKSFNVSPVVLTSISSDKGSDAVTVRKKDISTDGFSLLLQEQEGNSPVHVIETVDYIAAEPSRGKAGTVPFEIGRTKSVMQHDFKDITFLNTYPEAPIVILDLQTTNGTDPAALRWKDIASQAVKVKVEEEQSQDGEIEHVGESIGYIVFGIGK